VGKAGVKRVARIEGLKWLERGLNKVFKFLESALFNLIDSRFETSYSVAITV
jgi:hypothetical protein